jgi:predicted MFS family arabinose efflux permease
MAFLGDIGKFFNISTPEAAQIGSAFATGVLLVALDRLSEQFQRVYQKAKAARRTYLLRLQALIALRR